MLQDVKTYLESIGVPETGGDGWTDKDWASLGGISSTEAFDAVVDADWLFTSLARTLRMRKALIQAPVLWELRKLNPFDFASDAAVKAGQMDDCGTGWGQIFAETALKARNYRIGEGIINGEPLDYDSTTDLRDVWDQFHHDEEYNVRTVAYVLLWNSEPLGVDRPDLSGDVHVTEAVLGRYNGTDSDAEQYGRELMGLYSVLEQYNALSRAQ
ncbi:hypothetical protein [Streptomyces sp. NEAU-W12]|uniref:hypothetical protein n=1 Tax=Streptomyces sp. NEAU-W12 TaxID=2994668 RepID=UPI00224A7328|nr:hypothetical protein [Streptomyces sp. NEAU-W12]MCX2924462.1 hypothetical protein [Streptomyces sp. NEAU-W12]